MTKRFHSYEESAEFCGLKKPEYFDTKTSDKKTSKEPLWRMTKGVSLELCLFNVDLRKCWEGSPCRGDNLSQPYLLGKATYSGRDLPESYAQQIFASWPRHHAPMICSRANSNNTSRCLSLSIPATILTRRSNKSNSSGASSWVAASRSWPITFDHASWFQHFEQAPTAISSISRALRSSNLWNW